MNLTFACLVLLGFGGGSGGGQPQNSTEPMRAEDFTYEAARHLLFRAGFGGTPEQVEQLRAMGLDAAVGHLVDYETTPDPLPTHGIVPQNRIERELLAGLSNDERTRLRNMYRRADQQKLGRLRGWWVERMLKSPRPLEEKMVLFWHGHFTSGYRDVRNAYHMALQNELFREHATGSFAALVREISRDPAMLEYLDNNRNNRRAPNENYGRELMELFTLGVGNYTEEDIKEAARAFTGWTFVDSRFVFRARNHDYGEKRFLGERGNFDGDDIARILLEQAAAPRHVARKILTWFAIEPTDAELEPYAELLRRSRYEIKPLLRTLFRSQWFYGDAVAGRQVKSPVALVVGMLRALGVADAAGQSLARACDSIGQSLFEPPNVKGWDGGADWITSSNLLGRYNISRAIVAALGRESVVLPGGGFARMAMDAPITRRARQLGTARPFMLELLRTVDLGRPEAVVQALELRFLLVPLAQDRRQALLDFLAGDDASPPLDPQNRRRAEAKLRELLHLLAVTPEFQLC